jgi:hypothetical protein
MKARVLLEFPDATCHMTATGEYWVTRPYKGGTGGEFFELGCAESARAAWRNAALKIDESKKLYKNAYENNPSTTPRH